MRIIFYTLIFFCIFSSQAMAHSIAQIDEFEGSVKVYDAKSDTEKNIIGKGYHLKAGDKVTVGDEAWARLAYKDGSVVLLKEKSELVINEEKSVTLAKGRAFFRMLKQYFGDYSINIRGAVIGIRGTTFLVDIFDGSRGVYLKEGRLNVSAVEGEFERYLAKEMDEFEQYKKKEEKDFEDYVKKMEEEFVEFVKEFELTEGKAVIIDGMKVNDVEISDEIMSEIEEFELSLNEDEVKQKP